MRKTNIILLRHAEKLEWDQGIEPCAEAREAYIDNHKLSPKGYERSHALVGYFTSRMEMVELMRTRPLALVIAQDIDTSSQAWGKSDRPRETIWPLIQYQRENCTNENRSNISPNLELRLLTKSQAQMIKEIIHDKEGKYDGKTVLICWCHQQLPLIAELLGVKNPPKWPKGRFDVTWVINLEEKHPSLNAMPQNLMFGDSPL